MPDPAEIIAAAIAEPPYLFGTDDLLWQYRAVMACPSGPARARAVAEAVIEALGNAGWVILPAAGPQPAPGPPGAAGALPSASQVRSWLTCHEWKPGTGGPAGALWFPPVRGRGVGIPDDDTDPDLIMGAIQRIADRMAMTPAQVLAEMMLQ